MTPKSGPSGRAGIKISDEAVAQARSTGPPTTGSREVEYMHRERREGFLHGPVPRRRTAGDADPWISRTSSRNSSKGNESPQSVDDDGCSCACCRSCSATRQTGKLIVPIVPDEARTSACRRCSARSASTPTPASCMSQWTPDTLLLQGSGRRTDPGRGSINEAAWMSSFIAAGTACFDARDQHHPVLHLLLDVRLPAYRRPDLGGRHRLDARLPARRHVGPDDFERRGGCSTKTATATCPRCR